MKTLNVEQILNLKWAPTEERSATDPERYCYTVKKITNSLTPHVRDLLDHLRMADYCDSADWNVVIV